MNWGDSNTIGLGQSNINFNGNIQEVLFFSEVLSETDRLKVNYYLSKKWGLESSMDSDGDTYTNDIDLFPFDLVAVDRLP